MNTECGTCRAGCNEGEMVTLQPCGCDLCFRCLLRLQAQNTDDTFVHCDEEVTAHIVRIPKRDGKGFRSVTESYRPKKRSKTSPPAPPPPPPQKTGHQSEAFKFLQTARSERKLRSLMGKKGLLLTEQTLVGPDDSGTPFTRPLAFSAVPLDGNIDDDTKNSLVEHFKIFHQVLIPSSKTGSANVMSPSAVLEHYMTTDRRALFLCFLAVATGHTSIESFKEAFTSEKKGDAVPNAVLAIGMATDVLSRAVFPKEVGPAVACMSNMFRHASDTLCESTLSKFKVVTSSTAGTKYDAKAVVAACLNPEVHYKPTDLVMLMADNVNWKVVSGRQSGTVMSWTLAAHRMPEQGEMEHYYGENAPSRTRKDWIEDFVKKTDVDDLIRDVFLANSEDINNLNELLLIQIKAVLMSYETLSEQDFAAMKSSAEFVIKEGFPRLERIFEEADLDGLTGNDARGDGAPARAPDDGESSDPETTFEKNKVKPSFPLDLDFSKTEVIEELFQYLIRIAEEQVREWEEAGSQGVPPISKDFILFVCDGAPVLAGLNIHTHDVDEKYKRILVFAGLFHAFMEFFKKSNAREEDLLSHLILPFYSKKSENDATERNLSYFIDFNDPIIPEKEVGALLVALIFTAVLEMQESGRTDATPANVLKYMVKQAEASPQDMRTFMLFKYLGVLLLFRKAERCNKIDLYFSCMRLSLPLLAVENAKSYVLIFTEMLKYWEYASEREKSLIRKYGFTLETPNGVHIAVDFGMEKYVRLVRESTGKIKRSGIELKIESAALTKMSKQDTEGIKDKKQFSGKSLKRYDGRVLAMAMVTLRDMGAWSEKPERKPREPDTNGVYSLRAVGERLTTEMLCTESLGTSLLDHYLRTFTCSDNDDVTKRENTGISKRDYTVESASLESQRLVALATSVSVNTFASKDHTIKELKDEIERLKNHVAGDIPDISRIRLKKEIAKVLIDLRKRAFEENPNLENQFADEAKDKAYGGRSTVENRRAELERPFFSVDYEGNPGLTDFRLGLNEDE